MAAAWPVLRRSPYSGFGCWRFRLQVGRHTSRSVDCVPVCRTKLRLYCVTAHRVIHTHTYTTHGCRLACKSSILMLFFAHRPP